MATVISLRQVIETLDMQGEDCLSYLDPYTGEIVSATEEVRRLAEEPEESQNNLPEWQRDGAEGPRRAGEQPLPAVAGPL